MHEIRWRSSDLRAFATQPGNASAAGGGETHHGAKPISTGSVIVIGVCVPLVILTLIGFAALVFRRRMKRARISAQVELTATQQSTLPEVYTDADRATQPDKAGAIEAARSGQFSPTSPTEAAPLYEADGSNSFQRTGY